MKQQAQQQQQLGITTNNLRGMIRNSTVIVTDASSTNNQQQLRLSTGVAEVLRLLVFRMRANNSKEWRELKRIDILNITLKLFGKFKTLKLLMSEHDLKYLNLNKAFRILIFTFAVTTLLQSPIYRIGAKIVVFTVHQFRRLATFPLTFNWQQHGT